MNPNIKISVILSAYNAELYLKEAIDSILIQDFQDFECIIINDGSVDSTEKIILGYNDPRIVYIKNDSNKGLVYSLNKGIEASQGKYIVRMDSDDICFSNRLQVQYDYMESHPEIGISGTAVEVFFDKSTKRQVVRFPEKDSLLRVMTFFQSPFFHPSVIIRKDVLLENKLFYPKDFYRAEDYALWIELMDYTKIANNPTVLLHYRRHAANETALALEKEYEQNQVMANIQEKYMAKYNISFSKEDMFTFSLFFNRTIKYDLSYSNQQKTDRILKSFITQLSQGHKHMKSDTVDYISTVCFYRFFQSRSLPMTWNLLSKCTKGFFLYAKRIILSNN